MLSYFQSGCWSTVLCHVLGYCHQQEVNAYTCDESCQGINEVMGLNVDRGEAQENVERQEDIGELAATSVPCQQHAHSADADV